MAVDIRRFFSFILLLCCSLMAVMVLADLPSEASQPSLQGEQTVVSPSTAKHQDSEVPAGFEFLMAEQTTLADVYYGGRPIAQTLVSYTPSHVRLESPAAVVQKIPSLLDASLVQRLLSAQLNNNVEKACHSRERRDCGQLQPETVAVIFNPDSFRLDLFINSALLVTKAVDSMSYLPLSSSNTPTFVQELGLSYSGSEGGDDIYNLHGASVLGYREQSIRSNWSRTDADGFEADTLYWERDKNGKVARTGYLRGSNDSLTFSSSPQLLGVHFGSSRQTRIDYELQASNDIQVFMPVRGRVEVYRDHHLIASEILDVGNHLLDTRSFPSGGYNIDVVVKTGGQELSRETRYFVKDSRLPPKGGPEYYLELGRLVDNQEGEGYLPSLSAQDWQLRSGIQYRLADSLGVGVGLAADRENVLIEPNMIWLLKGVRFNGSLLASKQRDYGYASNVQWLLGDFVLSVNSRRLYAQEERDIADPSELSPVTGQPLLGDSYSQHSLNLGYHFSGGNLAYSASLSKRDDSRRRIDSITWSRSLFQRAGNNLSGMLSLSKENNDYTALLSITYQYSTRHFSNSISPQVEWERIASDDGSTRREYDERVKLRSQWYDRDLLAGELALNNELDLGRGSDSMVNAVSYQHRLADIDAQLLNTRKADGEHSTSYTANVRSGFVLGGDYRPLIGGAGSQGAAIIVDIKGKDSGSSYFDIMINGQRQGYGRVGERTVISVRPYETYEVRLVARGENPISFRDRVETVTVYPGNAVSLQWQAEKLNIVFGRALSVSGEPIANAIIKGASGMARSDDYGLFQAELLAGESATLLLHYAAGECTLQVPSGYTTTNGVGLLGDMLCTTSGRP